MAAARVARVATHLSRSLQVSNIKAPAGVEWSAAESAQQSGAGGKEIRTSTLAVANRLYNQEAVKLDPLTPLSLEGALQHSAQARVITSAAPPHEVVHVNAAWEGLCRLRAEQVVGKPGLGFLHGPSTNMATVAKLNAALAEGKRVRVQLINYKGDGAAFLNRLQVTPLRSKLGEVTHLLGVLSEVEGASLDPPACEYTSLTGV